MHVITLGTDIGNCMNQIDISMQWETGGLPFSTYSPRGRWGVKVSYTFPLRITHKKKGGGGGGGPDIMLNCVRTLLCIITCVNIMYY